MSSEPTKQVEPENDATAGGDRPVDPGLSAGAVLDHGRYRLLDQVGSDTRCDAQLWRAKDGVLGRDVALTILVGDRSDSKAAGNARRTLERAMHASTFNHVGVARVLDVVTPSSGDPAGILGIVIAEWTHGTDLLELVEDGPLAPGTAARLLQPLAAAVEAAHHAGLVLGADHPQRIRVTPDGDIRMAFPGPMSHSNSSDDVRGLGATLYLLLTGRWALADGPEGLPTAPTGPDGEVVAPRTLRPTVPMELSTVALRALGNPDSISTTGGVRTGAAVLRVLEQHANLEAASSTMQATTGTGENEVWRTEDPKPDPQTRRKLLIGVGVLAATTLLVLGWIFSGVIRVMTGGPPEIGDTIDVGGDGRQTSEQTQPTTPPAPVEITGASAFNKGGTPDNIVSLQYLYDGDPSTDWSASKYNEQLGEGGISYGTGAVLTLANPVKVREVVVDSPSAGSRIEVHRISGQPNMEPSTLIGSGEVTGSPLVIPVKMKDPADRILVVITKLAPDGGKFSTQLNEVSVKH